ncbi:DNA recombination protein RmuC [Solilutibacter silvestris]|uniref:RmuC family n=1 Tax=Solilutibacter silvestris TaxID=1645665 RepID=A0A2K1Q165_9GAMM|nr:DNA recombination protein RmuC [Lysobacter silvestris]PNS08785.1 hypothetical protein Lysil_0414 [Lysobacter silvestris]
MPETSTLILILLVAVAIAIVLLVVLLLRKPDAALAELRERLEDALREEQRSGRGELRESLESSATAQSRRINDLTERTDTRLDAFQKALSDDAHNARLDTTTRQQQFADALGQRLRELGDRNTQTLGELRTTLETQLKALQADNAQKLEQMRATVDEKLQSTLETRLGESFRLVSERLEAVQRGLGEMQQLATGVGDLKRVLTNVKTRGTFGEVQLGALLEQVLTLEQYAGNVTTRPGSNERVEYAVRLPGQLEGGTVWLPIDAKFPHEDYERLLDAQERADADAANDAGAALERRIRDEAKKIRDKYIEPPHTTDFALLFLPTEGLYAEVLRRPGLFDMLQRELRVTPVGPTTLLAVLNSLQMGFRTLAIEKRSSEVWQTLGAIKSEFGKFGVALDAVKKKLTEASNKIDETGVRSRAIERKLRDVEVLPSDVALPLLGLDAGDTDQE